MKSSLLMAIAYSAIVSVGCGQKTQGAPRFEPAFGDVDGHEIRPFDKPGVKAMALVFVLPDCPIANSYMPELNRLHDAFAERGVRLLVVHVDSRITPDEARKHAQEYQLRAPVVLDTKRIWTMRAGATITPEVAVFSHEGELLYRGRIDDQYVGLGRKRAVVTSHDLEDALNAILEGRPVRKPRTEAVGCLIPEA